MTSTSNTGSSHTAATPSIRRRPLAQRSARMLLAAGGCTACLAVLSATAQARQHSTARWLGSETVLAARSSTPPSAATFCSNKNLSVSKVSSIVGTTVYLTETAVKNGNLECIYFGKTAASTAHPIDEVVISMQPKIPSSEVASTPGQAEAQVTAASPTGTKLIFTSLPSVGKTAFSWTYAQTLNGGQLVGIADEKGTTGYGAVVGGAAKTFGAAATHLSVLERLLALDMTA
jgi:hypothetical protein